MSDDPIDEAPEPDLDDERTVSVGVDPSSDQAVVVAIGGVLGERFEIRDELGRGGMGRVFLAFDRRLDREVALKFLTTTNTETIARFVREAKAQARLDHPHVCPVYDTGEVDGLHFVAMRRIPGKTLRAAADEMSVEQCVLVMCQIIDAVHGAHATGLIHRDIKPSNIMIETSESGAAHAWLMDFGLARIAEDPSLTQTGATIGTPMYMAPEQVLGRPGGIDRRTDVYALGATLYTAILGRTPFEATSSGEVLLRVLTDEPTRPRQVDPELDADLEAVLLKSLEKEKHHRYASARELAEDLRAFLDGRPVKARRAGLRYRLGKAARRHRGALAVATLAVLVLVATAALWVREELRDRAREQLSRTLAVEVGEIRNLVRTSHMLPLHDVSRELAVVERKAEAMREQLDSYPPSLQAVARSALGQVALASGKSEEAIELLEMARAAGIDNAAVAYDLARALGDRYQREFRLISSISDEELREGLETRLEAELLEPIRSLLAEVDDPAVAHPAIVEAFIQMHRNRPQQAAAAAQRAAADQPWSYEPYRIEVAARIDQATKQRAAGEFDGAAQALDLAEISVQTGLELAPSDPELRFQACRLQVERVVQTLLASRDSMATIDTAIAICAQASIADPTNGMPLLEMAQMHHQRGQVVLQRGLDPSSDLESAVSQARNAAALEPSNADAYFHIGTTLNVMAAHAARSGIDPKTLLNEAIPALEKALELDPALLSATNNLGNAWRALGMWQLRLGEDPDEALSQASAALAEGIRLMPDIAFLHHNLATVELIRGESLRGRGHVFLEPLERAIAGFSRAIELNASLVTPYSNLGICMIRRAEIAVTDREDPRIHLRGAVEAFEGALAIRPDYAAAGGNLGHALGALALHESISGQDPTEHFERAETALLQVLSHSPDHPNTLNNLGLTRLHRARSRFGEAIDEDLALAHEAFAARARVDALFATAPIEDIRVDLVAVAELLRQGLDPKALTASTRMRLNEATPKGPAVLEAAVARAELALALSPEKGALADGLSALDKALEVNPRHSGVLAFRGRLLIESGDHVGGEALIAEALAIDPTIQVELDVWPSSADPH